MRKGGLTILLLVLCLVGFHPTKGGAIAPLGAEPDSLNTPLEHYCEGIRLLHIVADTTEAQKAFQAALSLDSTYAPAHYKLAEMSLRSGFDPAALNHARTASSRDTTNKFYLELYARAQILAMELDGALESFRRLRKIDRHNPDNYRMTALLEEQAGNRPAAIALLDSAEVLFGRNPLLGGLKRRMLMQQGEHERALEEALEQIESAPYEAESHLSLGDIYHQTGRDSLARAAYQRALELDSTRLETLLTLADFHSRRRDYGAYFEVLPLIFRHPEFPLRDKISTFNRFTSDIRFYREFFPQLGTLARTLILSYPKEPEAVELYADYLIASGDIEQALALYKLRLEDLPPQFDYYTMVIDMESYLERPDSAHHYLRRAIAHFPENPQLRIQQGHLYTLHGNRYDEAEAAYREALKLASSDSLRSRIWGFMGDCYQRRSQGSLSSTEELFIQHEKAPKGWRKWLKRCYAAYDKALLFDRDNLSVLNNYAYFLALEKRDLERALEMSSRVVAIAGNEPTYLDTHAWVLFCLERYEEAKKVMQQAVSLDGRRSPTLLLHYGDILFALGEEFLAETYWKRALENGGDPVGINIRLDGLKNKKAKP